MILGYEYDPEKLYLHTAYLNDRINPDPSNPVMIRYEINNKEMRENDWNAEVASVNSPLGDCFHHDKIKLELSDDDVMVGELDLRE